jgi:hypothetical protein
MAPKPLSDATNANSASWLVAVQAVVVVEVMEVVVSVVEVTVAVVLVSVVVLVV